MSNNKSQTKKPSKVKSIDSQSQFVQKSMINTFDQPEINNNSSEIKTDASNSFVENTNSTQQQTNNVKPPEAVNVSPHTSKHFENDTPANDKVQSQNVNQTQSEGSEIPPNKPEPIVPPYASAGLQNPKTEIPMDNKEQTPTNYQSLYEHSQFELEKLHILYSNCQAENAKLNIMLDTERKQLIEKLEEKSKLAQIQVEQKINQLELSKKDEISKIKESLASDIINAFIDPILLFESSIENAPKDNSAVISYLQGYTMIINMFKERLDSLGVQQIDVRIGDPFNEKFMSAFDIEHVNGVEPHRVLKIVSKGFVINKKIIKYVSVVVSK